MDFRPNFYVCGTPSDRRGFEYVVLDGARLPGSPPAYLDVISRGNYPQSSTYVLERIEERNRKYLRFTDYRPINPSEGVGNRGAYIGVGFLVAEPVTQDGLVLCLDYVSEIFGHLRAHLGPGNAFSPQFSLAEYHYDIDFEAFFAARLGGQLCSSALADRIQQAPKGGLMQGPRRIILRPEHGLDDATERQDPVRRLEAELQRACAEIERLESGIGRAQAEASAWQQRFEELRAVNAPRKQSPRPPPREVRNVRRPFYRNPLFIAVYTLAVFVTVGATLYRLKHPAKSPRELVKALSTDNRTSGGDHQETVALGADRSDAAPAPEPKELPKKSVEQARLDMERKGFKQQEP